MLPSSRSPQGCRVQAGPAHPFDRHPACETGPQAWDFPYALWGAKRTEESVGVGVDV